MKCNHRHKVNDTKMRSLFKTLTARIIEILIDTLLFGTIFLVLDVPHAFEIASGLALAVEFFCSLTHYVNDRFWNRIQWGREVEDIEEENTDRVEHL